MPARRHATKMINSQARVKPQLKWHSGKPLWSFFSASWPLAFMFNTLIVITSYNQTTTKAAKVLESSALRVFDWLYINICMRVYTYKHIWMTNWLTLAIEPAALTSTSISTSRLEAQVLAYVDACLSNNNKRVMSLALLNYLSKVHTHTHTQAHTSTERHASRASWAGFNCCPVRLCVRS